MAERTFIGKSVSQIELAANMEKVVRRGRKGDPLFPVR